jgi:TolB-like protein
VIAEQHDIFGDGVNVAARLEALAEPGGICVSRMVRDNVRDKLDYAFEDLGEQQVKNIARPVRAYRVGGSAIHIEQSLPASSPPAALPLPDKPSIAVLPFANMSGDPEQEYFTDGMVEEIITALSRIRWLFVIARNSSFTYKGRSVDVKQVGRELGVRCVLEGSVRKAGGRVRITAQLIDTASGSHIWADRFDGALDGIFELQDQVASSVAGAIEPKLRQPVRGEIGVRLPGGSRHTRRACRLVARGRGSSPDDTKLSKPPDTVDPDRLREGRLRGGISCRRHPEWSFIFAALPAARDIYRIQLRLGQKTRHIVPG